jgi:hypothetical protein
VPVRAQNNAWKGTWGLPPPAKARKSPYYIYCVGAMLNPTKEIKKKRMY